MKSDHNGLDVLLGDLGKGTKGRIREDTDSLYCWWPNPDPCCPSKLGSISSWQALCCMCPVWQTACRTLVISLSPAIYTFYNPSCKLFSASSFRIFVLNTFLGGLLSLFPCPLKDKHFNSLFNCVLGAVGECGFLWLTIKDCRLSAETGKSLTVMQSLLVTSMD